MKFNRDDIMNIATSSAGALVLFPVFLLFAAVLAIWNAWWIQDIWADHLVGMLGSAPDTLVLAVFAIGFRTLQPTGDSQMNPAAAFLLGPMSWFFANLVMWLGS